MINSFKGNYAFLSNFYPASIPYAMSETVTGTAKTAEHLFAACKTNILSKQLAILNTDTPAEAKKLGRKCHLRSDWNYIKLSVMYTIVTAKFMYNPDLMAMLVATGNQQLIEGNYWHDNYWGVCNCPRCVNKPGQNYLGQILISIRDNTVFDTTTITTPANLL